MRRCRSASYRARTAPRRAMASWCASSTSSRNCQCSRIAGRISVGHKARISRSRSDGCQSSAGALGSVMPCVSSQRRTARQEGIEKPRPVVRSGASAVPGGYAPVSRCSCSAWFNSSLSSAHRSLVCSNELTKRCTGSPAATGDKTGPPVRWYLGRQWAILIALAIRPIRPRVASNAITPRAAADLVGPPLLVLLGLPVVASDHTEQISHGPLTFKDSMAISPISVSSVSTGGSRHRQRADGLRTAGRFSRRLQLGPGLAPPSSWSLSPCIGPRSGHALNR
jgi:hypothetical protein